MSPTGWTLSTAKLRGVDWSTRSGKILRSSSSTGNKMTSTSSTYTSTRVYPLKNGLRCLITINFYGHPWPIMAGPCRMFLGRHRSSQPEPDSWDSWDFQLNGLHEGSDQVIMVLVMASRVPGIQIRKFDAFFLPGDVGNDPKLPNPKVSTNQLQIIKKHSKTWKNW